MSNPEIDNYCEDAGDYWKKKYEDLSFCLSELKEHLAMNRRALAANTNVSVKLNQETAKTRELESKIEELIEVGKESLVIAFTLGYGSGHHDTVEGIYVDVHPSDLTSYFKETVEQSSNFPKWNAAVSNAKN